jgi:hypothetical protein
VSWTKHSRKKSKMTKATIRKFVQYGLTIATIAAWVIPSAHAQTPKTPAVPTSSDASVTFRVSTLGLGLELGKQFSSHFAGRLGFNNYSLSRNATYESVPYSAKLKLNSVSALADYYPSEHGSFHLTGGLVIDNNRLSGTGKPSGSETYTINGQTYTVTEVGTLSGSATFNKYVPYFGIGFGRPDTGGSPLRLLLDIGVVLQGKPDLSLTASGAAADPSLASDVQAVREKTQSDLDKFQVYPVVSVGLAYHF